MSVKGLDHHSSETLPRLQSNRYSADNNQEPSTTPGSISLVTIIAYGLHVLLVVFHIALFVVWLNKWEQKVTVNPDRASTVSTSINAALQIATLLLTTAVTALMQPILIRAEFEQTQTLTALADKVSSWSGLGASIVALYHNIRMPAALQAVFIVTVYFLAFAVVHTTTPLLFTVPVVNVTQQYQAPTLIATPSTKDFFATDYPTPSNFSQVTFDWYRSSAGLGLLGGNFTVQYPGLEQNRIYDTLITPLSSTNASASVGYTDFWVTCGQVPEPPIIYFYPNMTVESMTHDFVVETVSLVSISSVIDGWHWANVSDLFLMPFSDTDQFASNLWAPADVLIRIPTNSINITARNLLLYSMYNNNSNTSQPILDSSGSSGRSVEIDFSFTGSASPLPVQVIGCTVSLTSGTTVINAATNRLMNSLNVSNTRNRTWSDWNPDLTFSNGLEDAWASMFMPQHSMSLWHENLDFSDTASGVPTWSCLANTIPLSPYQSDPVPFVAENGCHAPTVIEKYVTDTVFGPSNAWNTSWGMQATQAPVHDNITDATLVALEDALAEATAMMFWTAVHGETLSIYAPDLNNTDPHTLSEGTQVLVTSVLQQQQSSTTVQENVLKGRLTISIVVLSLGTAASVVLLAVATIALVPRLGGSPLRTNISSLDGVGLLQAYSLNSSDVTQRLKNIDPNDSQARRKAGMFMVSVQDRKLVIVDPEARHDEAKSGSISSTADYNPLASDEHDEGDDT